MAVVIVFALSFVVVALAVCAMAVGVLCGRRPIAGSCGGLAASGGGGCAACTRPCAKARRRRGGSADEGVATARTDDGGSGR